MLSIVGALASHGYALKNLALSESPHGPTTCTVDSAHYAYLQHWVVSATHELARRVGPSD